MAAPHTDDEVQERFERIRRMAPSTPQARRRAYTALLRSLLHDGERAA